MYVSGHSWLSRGPELLGVAVPALSFPSLLSLAAGTKVPLEQIELGKLTPAGP